MLGTAGTVGVIIVPIVLIAIILAMWYCPFRRTSPSPPGAAATNGDTAGTDTAGVDTTISPCSVPSYELQTHRSSRLSRISEEGGHVNHTIVNGVLFAALIKQSTSNKYGVT
ncbi:hypothetical protein F5Y13DRAFT_195439 [Hypoxylon sp. FL1857]|nr:hypothetical protein F5Y13DRAFT_195439 [Hypoxylon sp. FL1857]